MTKAAGKVSAIRRQNLLAAKEHSGASSDKAFAEQLDLAPAYYSAIKLGRREIGESLARKIESRLGMPHGALDKPEAGSLG